MVDARGKSGGDSRPSATARERRATKRAVTYWQWARANGQVPTLDDLGPPEGHGAGEHGFLLKQDPDPGLSVFILCGETARTLLSGDPIGSTLSEALPRQIRDDLCRACARALGRVQPVQVDGAYASAGWGEVRYRVVFMPVRANRGFDHDYVLGAITSRRFERSELKPR